MTRWQSLAFRALLSVLLLTPPGLVPISRADSFFDAGSDTVQTTRLRITADFGAMTKQRDRSKTYPGTVEAGGSRLPVSMSVRGNSRLQRKICKYPPLRLAFDKQTRKDSVFASHKELKLVVKCRDAAKYADYVRKEFLIYKAYDLLSRDSFKVKWVDVDYIDDSVTDRGNSHDPKPLAVTRSAPGFLIEQKKRMGKRMDLTQVHQASVEPEHLDAYATLIVDLFQFMIGNTDYSVISSGDAEDCCHNIKLMARDGKTGFLPVPFDFDNSGLVNASYARPTNLVPVQKVTQRYYRGFCSHLPEMQAATTKFSQHRVEVIQLFQSDKLLSVKARQRSVKYLNEFFDLIAEEYRVKRAIRNHCR